MSVAFVGRRACAALCDLLLLGAIDATVVALTVRLAGLKLVTVDTLPLIPLAAFLLLLDFGYLVALTALGGTDDWKNDDGYSGSCGRRTVSDGCGCRDTSRGVYRVGTSSWPRDVGVIFRIHTAPCTIIWPTRAS